MITETNPTQKLTQCKERSHQTVTQFGQHRQVHYQSQGGKQVVKHHGNCHCGEISKPRGYTPISQLQNGQKSQQGCQEPYQAGVSI